MAIFNGNYHGLSQSLVLAMTLFIRVIIVYFMFMDIFKGFKPEFLLLLLLLVYQ